MTTESFDTLTGTGAAVAFSHSPQQFDTLTGSGGGVQFTTTTGAVTLNFDTLATSAQAQPFTASAPSATFTPATMKVEAWDAANTTFLGELENSFNRSFQDEMSGFGRGSVSILQSDADASLATKVLRFRVGIPLQHSGGTAPYAFSARVEQKRFRYDSSEEGGRIIEMSGRGLCSMWEDAVVFPYGGTAQRPNSDSRAFGWFSPELSTTGWASAVVALSGLAPNTRTVPPVPDPWFPPKGWSSVLSGSDWIWSRYTGFGTLAGTSLFRSTFSLASADRVAIFYTASSRCRIWLDGVLITPGWTSEPNEESFIYAHRATPALSSGTHYIAVEAESQAWTPTLPGVSRGLLHVSVHSGGGVGATYSSGNLLLGTSSSWKCLDYPTVYPAPTAGQIIRVLLEEAQARGALTGWTLNFTDTVDSLGQPWPVNRAQVFRVGQSYAEVLRQLADSAIDFRAEPVGLRLSAYVKDSLLFSNVATYTIGSNLEQIEEDLPQ